jgi:hypothetical protein
MPLTVPRVVRETAVNKRQICFLKQIIEELLAPQDQVRCLVILCVPFSITALKHLAYSLACLVLN